MKLGLCFLAMGGALFAAAAHHGGAAWWAAWPGGAFGIVGVAYLANRPRMLGKKQNGRQRGLVVLLLFPYFLLVGSVWRLVRRFRKGPAHVELRPGIHIGRRLIAGERLPEIATVLDLTAEFKEPYGIRSGRTYIGFPILDGETPPDDALVDLVRRLHEAPKPVYIHCAEGHGRTGLVACALLLSTGEAADPEDALAKVRERRPRATLSSSQRAQVRRVASILTGGNRP